MPNATQDTLDALKSAQSAPLENDLAKAYSQSASPTSGLTMYSLEAPAKLLYPVLTPLRNMIPRVVGGRGIQANWRAITGVNTNQMGLGVAEGTRGGVIAQSTKDFLAKFAFLGLENYVTFEADYASEGFDDVKARAAQGLLHSTMIQEEQLDYAGNATLQLGITPTPVVSGSTTGGSVAAGTYNVICVALTHFGFAQVAGFNNGTTGQSINIATANLVATYSKEDAGSGALTVVNAGTAQRSVAASVTTTGATSSITASVTPVAGAEGYAWFLGVAGSEVLTAVSSINSVVITAASGSSVNASRFVADNSTDSMVYDGILTQILKAGSGSYVRALPTGVAGVGSTLTSDGAGGIVELEEAFEKFWTLNRLSPDLLIVDSKVQRLITKLVVANGGAPLLRYNADFKGNGELSAGTVVTSYLNKTTGTAVKIMVHPNAAPGTIMFYSTSIPYALSGVSNVLQKTLRRDYYQIEWPLVTRRYQYGVYFDGVLQNYFPPAFGLIYNIAA